MLETIDFIVSSAKGLFIAMIFESSPNGRDSNTKYKLELS